MRTFVRPKNRTWNLVTQRAFEAHVFPMNGIAKFDNGWWSPEGQCPECYRWSSKRASIVLAPLRGPAELRLRFEVPTDAIPHPVTVRFTLNGKLLGTCVAKDGKNDVRYVVPNPNPRRPNVLRVEVSDTVIPVRIGESADWRQLGLMLRAWNWQPVTASKTAA